MSTVALRFTCRRRAAAEWASLNEVLLLAEIGVISDSSPKQFKIGDGVTPWNSIADVFTAGGGSSDWGDIEGDILDQADLVALVGTAQAAAIATAAADATTKANAAQAAAQTYADGLVVGLLDDRGNFDASGNLFPTTGGSGSAGTVLKGDLWTISVAGTLGGKSVSVGDAIRALTDTPGQTAGNWAQTENNFGYVAENSTNKVTTFLSPTDAQYPSAKLVSDALDAAEAALEAVAEGLEQDINDTNSLVDAIRQAPPVVAFAGSIYQHPFLAVPQGTRVTLTVVQDRLYYQLGVPIGRVRLSNPRVEVGTGQASAVARAGMCEWDAANGQPGALVKDWGTADCSTNGTKTFTNGASTLDLDPDKVYALMFICGGAGVAPTIVYNSSLNLRVPTQILGGSQMVLAIYDAGENTQRSGGFDNPPSVAADLTLETAANSDGLRNFCIFDVAPIP